MALIFVCPEAGKRKPQFVSQKGKLAATWEFHFWDSGNLQIAEKCRRIYFITVPGQPIPVHWKIAAFYTIRDFFCLFFTKFYMSQYTDLDLGRWSLSLNLTRLVLKQSYKPQLYFAWDIFHQGLKFLQVGLESFYEHLFHFQGFHEKVAQKLCFGENLKAFWLWRGLVVGKR